MHVVLILDYFLYLIVILDISLNLLSVKIIFKKKKAKENITLFFLAARR